MKKRNVALFLAATMAATILGSFVSRAAETDWPTKTVNIIVPYSAGGDTDTNARAMGKALSAEWGVNVVVSNVTGSGGSIASTQVKDSANDGYTILCNHSSLMINYASGIIDWNPLENLTCGTLFAVGQPETILVRADAEWNTIEELIEASKENPFSITMAASTGATTQWAPMALLSAGAQLNIVDAGSASDRIPALLGGHVDVITNNLATVQDYLTSGQFKALATCGTERSAEYPDIPTLNECGIDCAYDMGYTFWFPKDTDEAIVAKLVESVENVIANDEEYAKEIGDAYQQTPQFLSTEDSVKYYEDQLASLNEIQDLMRGNTN